MIVQRSEILSVKAEPPPWWLRAERVWAVTPDGTGCAVRYTGEFDLGPVLRNLATVIALAAAEWRGWREGYQKSAIAVYGIEP